METATLRGYQIIHARKRAQLSQQALAQQLQVNLQTLEEWEQEKSQPDEHTLAQLTEITGWEFLHAEHDHPDNQVADSVINFFVDLADWAEKKGS